MADTYQCAHCGGVFEKGWSDEEATAEAADNFGEAPKGDDAAVVCDDCYQGFMAWRRGAAAKWGITMETDDAGG
jgi:hypothetical protein